MFNENSKVKLEITKNNSKEKISADIINMTNPINNISSNFSDMVASILDDELPMLKSNTLLHELVLYTLTEKVKAVQTVENVLSYIKKKNVKEIDDVHFENGEVCIKCSM